MTETRSDHSPDTTLADNILHFGRLLRAAGLPVGAGQIIDATNGLPLYVEELTKSLIEAGQIRRERNVFRATSLAAQAITPPSLQR